LSEISDIEVIAYVDGCLDEAARTAFEQRLAADTALAERVAAHRWMTEQIVSAFGPPPGDAIEPVLLAQLGLAGENVVPIKAPAARTRRSLIAAAVSGAMAASLIAGLFIGRWIDAPTAPWMRTEAEQQVLADGMLAEGLTGNLAGQAASVRIGMSFRTAQGVCRTFSTASGLSGLGCRQGKNWVLPIVTSSAPASGAGDYQIGSGRSGPGGHGGSRPPDCR